MKLARMKVLAEREIKQIHEATVAILAECGVQIDHPGMLRFLKEKGLAVDESRGIARFPRACLEDALAKAPPRFQVFDREGRRAFTLGGGKPRVAAGHNAVFWIDSATGQTRPSTVADVEQFARICDQLDTIDMIGIPVMPQDVPVPRTTLLRAIDAVVRNSRKPVFFSTDNQPINRAAIDMLAAAFRGDMREQVYGISQLSPTSPLFWEHGVIEAIMDTAPLGVPLAILPEPNAGVSAPFTLAGLLTMNNAECLSGLAMIQMLRPGAKVMYANSWTATDMRSGAALVGSIEMTVCRIAGAQLARFYRVPSHTTTPNSDNHAHDEQNAWEKTFSQCCSVAAGNDLLVNCGMFATGMTCSHEQLLMDEEISAMARRLARGVEVNDDTIAAGLIKSIGPRGSYLTEEHTLARLRGGEYWVPRLAVRGSHAVWAAAGARDTVALAREQAATLGAAPGHPLDPARSTAVAEIMRGVEAGA